MFHQQATPRGHNNTGPVPTAAMQQGSKRRPISQSIQPSLAILYDPGARICPFCLPSATCCICVLYDDEDILIFCKSKEFSIKYCRHLSTACGTPLPASSPWYKHAYAICLPFIRHWTPQKTIIDQSLSNGLSTCLQMLEHDLSGRITYKKRTYILRQ